MDAQARAWKRSGPPLNVAAVAIAAALGVNLVKGGDSPAPDAIDLAPSAPTLADLTAAVPMPIAGGDTLATSLAILEKLKGQP